MIKIVKRNKKRILLLGITILILGMVVLPSILPESTGRISGGFMKDGERVPVNYLQSFVDPLGNPVDGVWMEVGWDVTGENVVWSSFRVWGFYGIRLWNSAQHIILVNNTFDFDMINDPEVLDFPYEEYTFNLATILDGQPYSDPGDTKWVLYFFADFHMSVEPTNPEYVGHTLYDMWDGETTGLTVRWIGGTFSGTGSVSHGW